MSDGQDRTAVLHALRAVLARPVPVAEPVAEDKGLFAPPPTSSQALQTALARAGRGGTLVISAAGTRYEPDTDAGTQESQADRERRLMDDDSAWETTRLGSETGTYAAGGRPVGGFRI